MPRDSPPSERTNPTDALPGLAAALDEEAVKPHLQAALFGPDRGSHVIERCPPARPLYVPGEHCLVRYRLRARDGASGEVLTRLVLGRVFPSESACAAFVSDRLAPLAARMRGRPETAPFAAPAAAIDELRLAAHVWPIDPELPTLVDATDRERMLEVFRETLPERLGGPLAVEDCGIELVSYRRRRRCLLRYTLAVRPPGADEVRRLTVYGKVSAFENETLVGAVVDGLRDRMRRRVGPDRFTVPRSLGSRPELGLSLLEAIPGEALIAPALEARLGGRQPPEAPPLEEMVATCAEVAATIHSSGLTLGRARTLDDELAGLRGEVAAVRQFAPELGERADAWLERIAARARRSEPLRLRLAHGDFKHEQLLFDGARAGLVDFDRVCLAEPALDLGTFLAHLLADARRLRGPPSPLGEELAEVFLRAYLGAAGAKEDEQRLRERASLYEATGLARFALRSRQDLDEGRSELAAALVDERLR